MDRATGAGAAEPPRSFVPLPPASVTADGFIVHGLFGVSRGDFVEVALGRSARLIATVAAADAGVVRCIFVRPLDPAEVAAGRADMRVIPLRQGEGARAGDRSDGEDGDVVARLPLPVRTALAVGGALALWGLVALALG